MLLVRRLCQNVIANLNKRVDVCRATRGCHLAEILFIYKCYNWYFSHKNFFETEWFINAGRKRSIQNTLYILKYPCIQHKVFNSCCEYPLFYYILVKSDLNGMNWLDYEIFINFNLKEHLFLSLNISLKAD